MHITTWECEKGKLRVMCKLGGAFKKHVRENFACSQKMYISLRVVEGRQNELGHELGTSRSYRIFRIHNNIYIWVNLCMNFKNYEKSRLWWPHNCLNHQKTRGKTFLIHEELWIFIVLNIPMTHLNLLCMWLFFSMGYIDIVYFFSSIWTKSMLANI
jgi:hypothetical protein